MQSVPVKIESIESIQALESIELAGDVKEGSEQATIDPDPIVLQGGSPDRNKSASSNSTPEDETMLIADIISGCEDSLINLENSEPVEGQISQVVYEDHSVMQKDNEVKEEEEESALEYSEYDMPPVVGSIYAGDYIKRQSISMPHLWPQIFNPLARNDSTVTNI